MYKTENPEKVTQSLRLVGMDENEAEEYSIDHNREVNNYNATTPLRALSILFFGPIGPINLVSLGYNFYTPYVTIGTTLFAGSLIVNDLIRARKIRKSKEFIKDAMRVAEINHQIVQSNGTPQVFYRDYEGRGLDLCLEKYV